jgi:hypothetical protein
MKMNLTFLLPFIVCVQFCPCICTAQQGDPYEIIQTLIKSKEISTNIPLLDSLTPWGKINIKDRKWDILNTEEKTELVAAVKIANGFKLHSDTLKIIPLLPSTEFLKSFEKGNAFTVELINKYKPFYWISNPIFLHNNSKAVFSLFSIPGLHVSYLYEKKNGEWAPIAEFDILMN